MTDSESSREFAVLAGAVSTAMIETDDGPIPLDWIACGDRVLTRDAGFQTVLWVARTPLDIAFMRAYPEVGPVTLEKGLLGKGCPVVDLVVSPSQLVPLHDPDLGQVLVSADVIAEPIYPSSRQKRERFTYVNVLLDKHHLIRVQGTWMGSLFTADLDTDNCTDGHMHPVAPIVSRAAALGMWARLTGRRA